MKTCAQCLTSKPHSAFNTHHRAADGYQKVCRACKVSIPDTKRCTRCGVTKKIAEFSKNSRRRDQRENWCRPCVRLRKLLERYSLSLEEYEAMVSHQDGRCAICGRERKLVVDHCHAGGETRELLCYPCNTGLGVFEDDMDRLRRAADYLSRHQG